MSREAAPQMSVVMGVLNGDQTIREQLQAVLWQVTEFAFEVIVVDHGSTDETVQIVERLATEDCRLRLVNGAHLRSGGAAPKNLGVQLARSGKIAFCDADDLVNPGWLQGLYEGLKKSPIVFARFEYWSLNPHHVRRHRSEFTNEQGGGAFGIWKSIYLEVGMFDEEFKGAVDTEFFFRAQNRGVNFSFVENSIVSVRLPHTCRGVFRRQRSLCRSVPELEFRSIRHFKSKKILLASFLRFLKSMFGALTKSGRYGLCAALGGLIGRLEGLRDLRRRQREAVSRHI